MRGGPEGWDGRSVKDHVESAAGEAARAHEELERLEGMIEGQREAFAQELVALAGKVEALERQVGAIK